MTANVLCISRAVKPEYGVLDVRLAEVVAPLSYALDLTEGQPFGHAARACVIGMRIARLLGMPEAKQADLYYALLLKDAGGSSNASRLFHILNADEIRAKHAARTVDWTRLGWDSVQYAMSNVPTEASFMERMQRLLQVTANHRTDSRDLAKIRGERGALLALRMGFSERVAAGINSIDEHWNGLGSPDGLRGDAIPLFSRIMLLAQTLEVFYTYSGPDEAISVAQTRSGRWFDPDLVRVAAALAKNGSLWLGLENAPLRTAIAMEPMDHRPRADADMLDHVCDAFGDIIDAKSPFTYRHSVGVADAAVAIGRHFSMSDDDLDFLRRASLLHDLGKLGVSNTLLEKPGKLTSDEWELMKVHPYFTMEILNRVPGFGELSDVAAAHHERLDGSGYFRKWGASQLNLPARILAVADVFDALSAKRPYRDAMPLKKIFASMDKEAPHALDADCVAALKATF
jgi:HD-GYP domain-containing protein (c-di-GMP phosphodiesterase class II)